MPDKIWKVVGINFDHMHMGDNLRMVFEHPLAEISAICDDEPKRMLKAQENFNLLENQIFTDYKDCIRKIKPDMIILCPATAEHSDWVCALAPYGIPILMEKPFACSVEDADKMIDSVQKGGGKFAINWPLAWYPSHRTAQRFIRGGAYWACHRSALLRWQPRPLKTRRG